MKPHPSSWRHRAAAGLALAAFCGWTSAAADLAGRWEGMAQVPGAPQRLVIDLARGRDGVWVGSMTMPGRGVKGAPLLDLVVDASGVRAGLAAAFPFPFEPAPRLSLQATAGSSLAGRYEQGGHGVAVKFSRTGPAQVDRMPLGTAVLPELQGQWRGRYELAGVPREVTLQLANGSDGLAHGKLRIVSRRTSWPVRAQRK